MKGDLVKGHGATGVKREPVKGDAARASAVELFARGRLEALGDRTLERLLARGASEHGRDDRGGAEDRAAVTAAIAGVRSRGDAALRELAQRYDGVALDALEVPRPAWDDALASIPAVVCGALARAVANIRRFHQAQVPVEVRIETEPGVRLTHVWRPLERVGVYAPGGRAAYPSSVLMGVVPAKAAGVREVVVCSPAGSSGLPPREVLAACALGGADRLFALGGVGAIAALAYGTESVPAVDGIVGPGNRWVTEAKRQVAGDVPTDGPAGPSEVLVLADDSADPALLAHELLAQAEHDPDAACVLVTTSQRLAADAEAALGRLLEIAPRQEVARTALAARGAVLWARDVDLAVDFAVRYAPEHLVLMTTDAVAVARRVSTAGTVFAGPSASVAFGDYLTGANHVLPTGGRARSWSGLSAHHFMRSHTIQEVDAPAAATMADDVAALARAEGLPAHAAAALARSRRAAGPGGESAADVTPLAPGGTMTFPRKDYRALSPHAPDRRPAEIDLSDNTNLWGTHPAALERIRGAGADDLARYPQPYADTLREAVSRRFGVPSQAVTSGAGSDDVLDSAFRAAAGPGAAISFPGPTFSMVRPLARMNGLEAHEVPWTAALADPYRLLEADPAVVYVCRPDNPTGALAPAAWLERLFALVGARGPLIVLDEAYADFAGETLVTRAPELPRLLVVRTTSKAYGLAGLRCGYGVASPEVALEVEKSRGPYKVSRLAAEASALALTDRERWMARTVEECARHRRRLWEALERRGLDPLDSRANFLLFRAPSGSAERDALALRERGVAVRPFPNVPGLGDGLRVTVGPWPLLQRFLEALDATFGAEAYA